MSRRVNSVPSKEHLLAAAIECFATHGFQGTTIDRIARVAGVTKGALYYHFKDKEDLLFETVRNRVVEFEDRVLEQTADDDSPWTTLARVLQSCFVTATESNHRRFIMTLMVEALDTNPRLSESFRLELRRMRAFLAEVVRKGQEAGQVKRGFVPHEVAAVIVATIMGAEIQHYQDPERIDLRTVLDLHLAQITAWLRPEESQSVERGEHLW